MPVIVLLDPYSKAKYDTIIDNVTKLKDGLDPYSKAKYDTIKQIGSWSLD